MRPKSKDELLKKANSQFDDLWKLINGMSEEDRKQSFQFSEEFLAKKKGSTLATRQRLKRCIDPFVRMASTIVTMA